MGTSDRPLVLFDLGGVLMRLSGVGEMQQLAGLGSEEEVWARWLGCAWVRSFERGRCSVEEFARGIVRDWALATTPEEFIERFRGWPVGLFPGAEDLVGDVRGVATVGCLSNSNELHWSHQAAWGLGEWFDHAFLSHEMGLIKPDPDVFDHVAESVGLEPARITLLDDNLLNVEAARDAGFTAEQVRGPGEARASLARLGLLPS